MKQRNISKFEAVRTALEKHVDSMTFDYIIHEMDAILKQQLLEIASKNLKRKKR